MDDVGHLSAHSLHWMQLASFMGNTLSLSVNMCIGQTLMHIPQLTQVEVLRKTTLLPAMIPVSVLRNAMPEKYSLTGTLYLVASG